MINTNVNPQNHIDYVFKSALNTHSLGRKGSEYISNLIYLYYKNNCCPFKMGQAYFVRGLGISRQMIRIIDNDLIAENILIKTVHPVFKENGLFTRKENTYEFNREGLLSLLKKASYIPAKILSFFNGFFGKFKESLSKKVTHYNDKWFSINRELNLYKKDLNIYKDQVKNAFSLKGSSMQETGLVNYENDTPKYQKFPAFNFSCPLPWSTIAKELGLDESHIGAAFNEFRDYHLYNKSIQRRTNWDEKWTNHIQFKVRKLMKLKSTQDPKWVLADFTFPDDLKEQFTDSGLDTTCYQHHTECMRKWYGSRSPQLACSAESWVDRLKEWISRSTRKFEDTTAPVIVEVKKKSNPVVVELTELKKLIKKNMTVSELSYFYLIEECTEQEIDQDNFDENSYDFKLKAANGFAYNRMREIFDGIFSLLNILVVK